MTASHCDLVELRQLEAARQATLDQTASLTQVQANFNPDSKTWSVGEIMDHLVLIQKMYEAQIRALMQMAERGERPVRYLSLADIDVGINFIPKAILPMFEPPLAVMNFFVPTAVREMIVRNPVVKSTAPALGTPTRRPLDLLRKNLAAAVQETRELFDTKADLRFSEMRVLHPLFGNNTVPGLLLICAAHEKRHQTQIAKIIADPAFPRA